MLTRSRIRHGTTIAPAHATIEYGFTAPAEAPRSEVLQLRDVRPRYRATTPQVKNEPGTVLSIGVLLDSLEVPAWIQRAVQEVTESPHARIELVILRADAAPTVKHPAKPRARWKKWLFDAYERFDRWWFSDGRLDPFETTTLAPLLKHAFRIDATTTAPDGRALSLAAVGAIADADLDVLLRFGFASLRDIPPGIARHGVWSIDASLMSGDADLLGGFWEVLRGSAVNESRLDVQTPGTGTARTIYRSFGSTSPVSVWKTRRERYWKVASFMSRKLRDLSEQGPIAIASIAQSSESQPGKTHSARGSAELFLSLPRVAARYAALTFGQKAHFDQWFVAYNFLSGDPAEDGVPESSFGHFRQLRPPRDRMWADPFPISHHGQHYLFLEELCFARNRGHISVVEFENGNALRPEVVLETPHHLSYPFVLPWRGEMFLIPESARAGDSPAERAQLSIPVFRARAFPSDWVQETAMLENLEVFDPTLAEIEGRWWLFCARAEQGASSWDELHIFHAPTPLGPWTAHRRNPVKSDVRSARPAGRLFRRDGQWYRPAQDCSVRYGYGISINRITRLTPTEYEEVVVQHIAPDWAPNLLGTHTLNAAGRLTVVDALRHRWRWSSDAELLPRLAR